MAKPDYVRIQDISGSETANASLIGPYNEGTVITLVCVSSGGKPVAQLNWYNNSSPLQDSTDCRVIQQLPFIH
ncbi:Cell adhesion molecule 2 [Orchesella cincta]|uniref:Cell adhesion molecule 2 n=1 Tax=Orchesella cincta TaxID=48709 RepID=A0A1D2N3S8_ORCCI|nr:Cell adhesion molecule 2 [Orchesella cincta]